MKKIALNDNHYALVDDEDYLVLNRLKWSAYYVSGEYYVSTTVHTNRGKSYRLPMVKLIMPARPNFQIVHKDGNSLNNQKSNLVEILNSPRVHSSKKISGTYSVYKGVHYDKAKDRRKTFDGKVWRSGITRDGKYYHLGNYDNEKEAALAYNEKAFELYGEYAYQNKLE